MSNKHKPLGRYLSWLGGFLAFAAPSLATAQVFDSGSNGSLGACECLSGTCVWDMPPDGIFHCTRITVAAGATLRFNKSPLNTPVYMLAQDEVVVEGALDVSGAPGTPLFAGLGGPAGFDGGSRAAVGAANGDGHGPGAGLAETTGTNAGNGTYAQYLPGPNDGQPYGGALLIPLIGGSGGGGDDSTGVSHGGGGGGGALLLSSSTSVRLDSRGSVVSKGGYGGAGCGEGGGSGGAIRIVAPLVTGNGQIEVGGTIHPGCGGGPGGMGRIRIDSLDRSGMQFQFRPNADTTAVGKLMFVFPDVVPKLDIIELAGQTIPVGTPQPVFVQIPFGSPTSQPVKLQLRGAIGLIPVEVVVTPDNGPRVIYVGDIDMSEGNPAEATIDVEIPVNTVTHIAAWIR